MSFKLPGKDSKVIVQGITGKVGLRQTEWMLEAYTPIAGGVTPGKGGHKAAGRPVFNTCQDAVRETGATVSVMFVPPPFAEAAASEAIDAGIQILIIVTEHIPMRDAMLIRSKARRAGITLIGPNCPGIFLSGYGKVGIMPTNIFKPGNIGVVGRSATLSYEVILNLSHAGLGQSAAVGIGGDPVIGTGFCDVLQYFENDPDTTGVVLIGEIGGSGEEEAARYIRTMQKPVSALIAGRALPPGRRFGHAGAIVRKESGGADYKMNLLRDAGCNVAESPSQVPILMKQQL
jgi:succinyl-CoA synthetase alpha subunit